MNEERRKISNFHVSSSLHEGEKTSILEGRFTQAGGVVQSVVLKVLKAKFACIGQELRLFLREVEWARELRVPLFPRVFEAGEYRGTYFLAMEKVHGWTLSETLRTISVMQLGMPAQTILWVLSQLSSGFIALKKEREIKEGASIVHLGIDPTNILLCKSGNVRLVDFGRTQESGVQSQSLDSFSFDAPEFVSGQIVDERTDLYSLGKLLEQMSSCLEDASIEKEMKLLWQGACHSNPMHRFQRMEDFLHSIESLAALKGIVLEREGSASFTAELFGHKTGQRDRRAGRPQSMVPMYLESEQKVTSFSHPVQPEDRSIDAYKLEESNFEESNAVTSMVNQAAPTSTRELQSSDLLVVVEEDLTTQGDVMSLDGKAKFVDADLMVTAFSTKSGDLEPKIGEEEKTEQKGVKSKKFMDEHQAVTKFSAGKEIGEAHDEAKTNLSSRSIPAKNKFVDEHSVKTRNPKLD